MPYALAFEGGLLVAGLADGTVFTSADGGDTWEGASLEGERPGRIVAFA